MRITALGISTNDTRLLNSYIHKYWFALISVFSFLESFFVGLRNSENKIDEQSALKHTSNELREVGWKSAGY